VRDAPKPTRQPVAFKARCATPVHLAVVGPYRIALPGQARVNCDTGSVPLIKDPHPEPRVDPFRGGVATLNHNGTLHGHLFSTVEWLWTPFSPLRKQWWVWYIVVWSDGTRDDPQEDYQPWIVVDEIDRGRYEVEDDPHAGIYDVAWLPATDASRLRKEYGITDDSF
jgi:hypothetical protein